MTRLGTQVAVVGIGHSRLFRGDEVNLGLLAIEAVQRAIDDAGLTTADIDGLSTTPYQPFAGSGDIDGLNIVSPELMVQALKMDVAWSERQFRPVGASLINTIHAVASGQCKYAVCFRGLHHPSGRRYGHNSSAQTSMAGQFSEPYGVFAPAMYAHFAVEHFHRYGSTREQLGAFVVRNREQALKWEYGYWFQHGAPRLSIKEYLDARKISEPLGLFDCDIPVQAAGAFVVTSAERARDLKNRPAYVLATSNPFSASRRKNFKLLDDYLEDGKQLSRHLWDMAGIGPTHVDLANLYDGFSIHTPLWAEALGLCDEGDGFAFVANPNLPLNTSSGSLGAGRVHGIAHIMDSVLQVQGRSGDRQVKGSEIAVAATNPCDTGAGFVFASSPG
jgi:acetyl-CoA acetyltransferase